MRRSGRIFWVCGAFPIRLWKTAAFHESPGQATGEGLSLPRLIHLADRLVHERNALAGRPAATPRELESGLLEKLGLVDRWSEWLEKLNALDSVPEGT
jgi:hypothetical protein